MEPVKEPTEPAFEDICCKEMERGKRRKNMTFSISSTLAEQIRIASFPVSQGLFADLAHKKYCKKTKNAVVAGA